MADNKRYLDINGLGYTIRKINEKKADVASPNLTGTPTAPNAAEDTATTQIATTKFVDDYFVKKKENVLNTEIDDMFDEIIDGDGEVIEAVSFEQLVARVAALESQKEDNTSSFNFEVENKILIISKED